MKVFANVMFRNFNLTTKYLMLIVSNTTWFLVEIKTDFFNWYFDYYFFSWRLFLFHGVVYRHIINYCYILIFLTSKS
jgi:hypothetical protein